MRVIAVCLSFLLVLLPAAHGDEYSPVCDASDYTQRLNIPLPNQFSMSVEANILQYNFTVYAREAFDEVNNRGRLDFAGNGTEVTLIFDYDDEEVFLLPDRFDGPEVPCGVRIIREPTAFLNFTFGFTIVNGSVHIGSARHLFLFSANDSNARYLGVEEARGIPCDRWQTCTLLDNNSFTVDYYFSLEGGSWVTPYRNDPISVQIVLNGSRVNNDTGEVIDINHLYTFTSFNSGPESVPDELFSVPTGLICRDRIPGPPLPELGNYFSAYVETVREGSVQLFREFYDFEHELFRLDVYYNGRLGGDPGPISLIHDFQQEVQYVINRQYSTCFVTPILASSSLFDEFVGDDGVPHLRNPRQLLTLSATNFTYEGVTTVREVEVDAWITFVDFQVLTQFSNVSNATYEYFFTRPGLVITNDHTVVTEPIPWRFTVSGTFTFFNQTSMTYSMQDMDLVHDLFDYSSDEPGYDFFDPSVCFNPSDYHILTILVPSNDSNRDYTHSLRNSIRAAFVDYTGAYPLQFGNIEVVGGDGTYLFVTLHINNVSSVAQVTNPKTADEIRDTVVDNLGPNGALPFQINVGGTGVTPLFFNVTQTCPAIPTVTNTVTETTTSTAFITPSSSPAVPSTCAPSFTIGKRVGYAVGMLVLGLVVGVVSALLILCALNYYRKKTYKVSNTAMSYDKHTDDLEF